MKDDVHVGILHVAAICICGGSFLILGLSCGSFLGRCGHLIIRACDRGLCLRLLLFFSMLRLLLLLLLLFLLLLLLVRVSPEVRPHLSIVHCRIGHMLFHLIVIYVHLEL